MGKRKTENKKESKNKTVSKKDSKIKPDISKESKTNLVGSKENKKKSEDKLRKKKFFLSIPIILIIGIIVVVFLIQNPVEASDEAHAQLIIEFGTVEIKPYTRVRITPR